MVRGRHRTPSQLCRTTMGNAGDYSYGSSQDDEQRRMAFAGLADLDQVTADDEEEIGRFRAFVAEPLPQHKSIAWRRRRAAQPA